MYIHMHVYVLGNGSVANGMSTVTVSGLQCGVIYALVVEGISNGIFVGPASSHGNISTGPCPVSQVSV